MGLKAKQAVSANEGDDSKDALPIFHFGSAEDRPQVSPRDHSNRRSVFV